MNDPIADLLVRIKNASLARRLVVEAPYSRTKESLAKILVEEGFLAELKTVEEAGKKRLRLSLLKGKGDRMVIEVRRLSKLGRRVYIQAKKIPILRKGIGTWIISTPKGLMTASRAQKENLGGEVLCKVV